MYSQGYRIKNDHGIKIIQTGGAFFKMRQSSTKIKINNEIAKELGFLERSTLIKNLTPKTHNFKIEKEGFFTWEKNLEILPKQVTEARGIILFPSNLELELYDGKIIDYFLSPNGNKIAIVSNTDENWSVGIYDIFKKTTENIFTQENFLEFKNLKWADNSLGLIIESKYQKDNKFFAIDLTKELDLKGFDIKSDAFIYIYRIKELEPYIAYCFDNGFFYYLSENGLIYRKKTSDSSPKILSSVKMKGNKSEIIVKGDYIFLILNNVLYQFNAPSQEFKKIQENVKAIKFSPDKKKLAINANNELSILYLEQQNGYLRFKENERIFLERFIGSIDNLDWINNHYLIFNIGKDIKISEIDNRDKVNVVDVYRTVNPKILYTDETLYILSENILYYTNKLID